MVACEMYLTMINILQRTSTAVLHADPQLISPEQTRTRCEFTLMNDHSPAMFTSTLMCLFFSSLPKLNKQTNYNSNGNNIHHNNSCNQICHTPAHMYSLLPEITAKVGNDVGVFTVLHHYDLLLNNSKVFTYKQHIHTTF